MLVELVQADQPVLLHSVHVALVGRLVLTLQGQELCWVVDLRGRARTMAALNNIVSIRYF